MTAKKRIQLGVWVSIVGLTLATVGSIGGGAIGYGKLTQKVEAVSHIASEADCRSIENRVNFARMEGKLDQILEHVRE